MSAWLELMHAHAALLLIAAPVGGAAVAALVGNGRLSWIVACIAALATACVAASMPARLWTEGGVLMRNAFGLQADAGLVMAPLIAGAGAVVLIGVGGSREWPARTGPLANALVLMMIAGACGALVAESWIGVIIAAETAWLAGAALVALGGERDRGALNGALRMIVAGGVASALLLLGAALAGRGAGSMRLAALAEAQLAAPHLVASGVGLMLLGLALKAGAAPLHFWTGVAYGRASGGAALALAVIGAGGAVALLLRVSSYALSAPMIAPAIAAALVALGAIGVAVGSMQAIGARNLRRLGAYAGAAQIGCILLSAALGSPAAFSAALVQLFAFVAAALALFGGLAVIGGNATLSTLDGLGRRAPLASAAITASALSLMGAPLTVGYLGRWRMIEAGVNAGWWWAAVAVIVASLAGVFYGGRLIERLYFRKSTSPYEGGGDPWRMALAPALIVSVVAIALGLEPSALANVTNAAGALMAGHGP